MHLVKELNPVYVSIIAEYVTTPYHSWLLADLALSHSISDICLVGPRGCGKSALVRQLAASLGYQTETIQLYQVSFTSSGIRC
jgi:ABC-type cobalamin/Fe3+-siderophores transport system ATPase subunit